MNMAITYPPEVLRRLQLAELEILEVIDALCEEHGISWFLEGGTLLGAVRHKGFIPWDDDVDVGLLRSEYERFLVAAENGLPEGYELQNPRVNKAMSATFAKVCKTGTRFWTQETIDAGFEQGIFVDVFFYDSLCADETKRKEQISKSSLYAKMRYLHHSNSIAYPTKGLSGAMLRAGFRASHALLSRASDADELLRKFEEVTHCPEETASDESFLCAGPVYDGVKTEYISNTIRGEFEGKMFPIPKGYEGFLDTFYGSNWTELPPEDQRKNHAPLVLDFGDGVNVLENLK